MDIQVYLIGPNSISIEKLRKCLGNFRSFTNVTVDIITRDIPLSQVGSQFISDENAARIIPEPKSPVSGDIAFGVVSVMLEDNWFARTLPNRKVAVTTFEIEDRNIEFWPTEKVLAYTILKFSLNVRFLQKGGDYNSLYTTNLENSIYNFAATKEHAVIGLRCLTIGSRASVILSRAGITDGELAVFESDLRALTPSVFQKFESLVRKNVWVSLGLSFLLGILASWLANRI